MCYKAYEFKSQVVSYFFKWVTFNLTLLGTYFLPKYKAKVI